MTDTFGCWEAPWSPLQRNKIKALSLAYKLLFILSKNIVPSRSYRYIRDRAFPVTRLPPPIYTKFDVSNGIYIFGCWQAPWTPLYQNINIALSVTYKLLFILSKNIVPSRSYRYIRYRAFPVTCLPPPIYTKFDVSNGIWVLASTLDPSVSKINEALSVTYKLLFIFLAFLTSMLSGTFIKYTVSSSLLKKALTSFALVSWCFDCLLIAIFLT